jgi:SEC-C motif-containing protein
MQNCPCDSGKPYSDCCGLFIACNNSPATPEELMRSRYTAYTQANIEYIMLTMRAPASNNFDAEAARKWAQKVKWIKLEIKKTSIHNTIGYVEFVAYFNEENTMKTMHELSEFHLDKGKWYYVDGKNSKPTSSIAHPKIKRNDLCLCGSGKKHKKCCGQ